MADTISFEPEKAIAFEPDAIDFQPEGQQPTETASAGYPPEEPGRITRQPQTLKEWGSFLIGGMLHPIRQVETLTEQALIQTGLAKPGERLKVRPSELLETPAVTIPKVKPAESKVGQVAGGLANSAIDFAQFLLTPEGVLTMGLGSVKESVRRAVMIDFAGQMATSAPDQFNAAYNAAQKGDLQGAVQHATSGTAGSLLAGVLAAKGAFKDAEPIAPLTSDATSKVTETTKPEVSNASKVAETGQLNENVPAQPVKVEQAVPVEGSSEGVQSLQGNAPRAQDAARGEITPSEPIQKEVTPVEEIQKVQKEVLTNPPEPIETPVESKTTSIKNASVDAERQARGQEPIMAPTRLRNQAVWDKAMEKIDSDPSWQDRLITELSEKPRTPSAEEIVALDHRYVDLQNEYSKAIDEGSKAYESGYDLGIQEAKTRAAFFEEKLNEIEQLSRKIGAEWGRSGQMRQRLMREDYSLAAMESKMRAAKGFEPLTEAEHAEIASLHQRLAEAERKAVDVETKANQRIALIEAQKALAEARTQAGQVAYEPRIIAAAERFANYMDRQADAASKRLRQRLGRVSAGIDPTMLADVGIIGAAKITRGVVDSAKWIDEMAKDVGEWIREHKDEAWKIANKTIDESLSGFSKGKVPADKVKRASAELARLTREKEDLQARLMLDDYSPRRTKRTGPIDKEVADARAEVMLLREQFLRGLAKENYKRKSNAEKVWLGTKEAFNLSRALMTSGDFSAVLRQGGFVTFGRPLTAAKSIGPMLRAMVSEKNAASIDAEIHARQNAPLYEQSKLYLAPRDTALSGMEEAFMSKLARNIPGIAASNRAYVTFLNKLRADTFDQLYSSLSSGKEVKPEEIKAIANYINVATGRGNLGKTAGAAELLSAVFFSPRLVASRFQLLAGEPFYHGSARTRYMVAKEYSRFLLGLGAVYSLARMAGGTVEEDPRSSDFGKLKFGKTRVDPLAGLSQSTVLLSRLGTGETKSLKGNIKPIRGNVPYGSATSVDVITKFLRTKLSPVFGTAVDILTGKTVVGKKVTPSSVAQNLTIPMSFQDIYDVMEEQGVPAGTAMGLLSILGMSVQNYDESKWPK